MATTTNFGWETPDDTDLVKDGAAAIRTSLNGVDSSFVDLKGGTTGQILSKASATDLDYAWITNDVGDITGITAGTGISGGGTSGTVTVTNSMATAITTAGDLIKGTGSGTFDRLGIGSSAQVLTVVAGAPAWATPAAATSGLTLISRSTWSAAAAVNVNDVFTSTYSNYRILIYSYANNTYGYYMRLRAGGADNTASTYGYQKLDAGGTTVTAARSSNQTSWEIGEIHAEYNGYGMDIYAPQESTQTNFVNVGVTGSSTGTTQCQRMGGFYNTTSFDGFTLYPPSGNFTGVVTVYGYQKS